MSGLIVHGLSKEEGKWEQSLTPCRHSLERRIFGEGLIDQDPERIHVDFVGIRCSRQNFGGHVRRCSDGLGVIPRLRLHHSPAAGPEVCDLGTDRGTDAQGGNEDVPWLEVCADRVGSIFSPRGGDEGKGKNRAFLCE